MIFVGVDWAEAHHDVHVENEEGKRLGRARLPEGVDGIARLKVAVTLRDASMDSTLPPHYHHHYCRRVLARGPKLDLFVQIGYRRSQVTRP